MLIETLVISYLTGQLPGVSVVAEVPEEYTGEALVVVEKTADSRNNRVMRATFALQSYGGTLLDAATLSRRVRSAMDSLVERPDVSACRFETERTKPANGIVIRQSITLPITTWRIKKWQIV